MLVTGLLLVGVVLAGALAIRNRAPARPPSPPEPSTGSDVSPERRLWEIWKRLGWRERLTALALLIGGLGACSLGLYGLVLVVW